MMRAGMAALAVVFFLAAPAAAQPAESTRLDRAVMEAGRWSEQLGQAISLGTEGFAELNQRIQALAGTGLTGPAAVAAAPGLRQLIERNRENIRRSNAMLEALPPYPKGVPSEISGATLIADARAQNGRLLEVLGHYEAVFDAMGKRDSEALKRAMPRMLEGVFTLMGQQRLMFRNRQAAVPASDSSHQALGIAVQIYRSMEWVARQSITDRLGDPSASAKAESAFREEMRRIADDTRILTAAGRRNLEREMAEARELRRSASKDPARARLAERVIAVTALEEKTFAIGDRLAAFSAARAEAGPEPSRLPGGPSPLIPITEIESDFMQVAMEQAALTAKSPE